MNESPASWPETQPPGGWRVQIGATKAVITGEDFADFVAKVTDHLHANGLPAQSWETILARATEQQGN